MRIGYIRPDKRMGDAPQRAELAKAGVTTIYVEKDAAQSELEWIITRKMRTSHRDTVEVSDLHRLAASADGLADAIERICAKNGTVVDVRSGARSDKPGPFAKALFEAAGVLAGRLPRPDRSRIAKIAAAASPVTKSKSGAAPLHLIQQIMNDESLSVPEAVAKINRSFKLGVSVASIYRWKRQGKIHFKNRVTGARPK